MSDKTKTCGECRFYTRADIVNGRNVGKCRPFPMPMWAWPDTRRWEDCDASPCECFERKDATK